MARPEKRKAAKDYPDHGIVKGEEYYYVKIKTGPRSSRVMRQKNPFRRSQLTQSDYLQRLYEWEDSLAALTDMNDARDLVEEIRALGEEQREKYDNMPDGLQQGDTGQQLEQRADACESAAEELEQVVTEWESEGEPEEQDEYLEQAKEVSVDE